jgi:uncharacterized membrane protein
MLRFLLGKRAMTFAHTVNLGVHIGAGVIAMAIGLYALAASKGTAAHRRTGRWFAAFTLLVCASAVIGNLVFRFMPLFAVLTALVLYQLLSGWHAVVTKGAGPDRLDALLCFLAAFWAAALTPLVLAGGNADSGAAVIYASLGTLFALIAYDMARWLFPPHWHATLWRYEHIYKLVASLFAMLSAAAGNLLPHAQPWSQLLPSAMGIAAIGWFFWRELRRGRALGPRARPQHV